MTKTVRRARHIAIVTFSLSHITGPGRVAVFLARSFNDGNWNCSIITLHDAPDFYELPLGVDRLRLNLAKPSPNRLVGLVANGRRITRLRGVLRAIAPDLVLSLETTVNCLAIAAARSLGIPIIITDHTPPSRDIFERGPWWLAVRCLYPLADRLVCVSSRMASERAWLPYGKVIVIPNAVQADCEPALGDPLLAPAGVSQLLALGRLDVVKGFDLLIEAFTRLARHFPAWHLTILGDGPERAALEGLVARFGLDGRVRLPGAVRHPAPLLRAAAAAGGVFAFPSRYEGFPNALIEAMACGLPVVAADCPHGPREILEGGKHGVLVPPENPEALAEALARLMADPALRADYAARARARAADFAPEKIAPRWLALAEEVLAERGRSA